MVMNSKVISTAMKKRRIAWIAVLCTIVINASAFSQEAAAEEKAHEELPLPTFENGSWYEANIRSVFNHLSEVSGIDFILDPNVSGKVTLTIRNKNWKEICDIICKMKQLVAMPEEGYIYIMTEKDYFTQLQSKEVGRQNLAEVESLERTIIELSNITADEMAGPVKDLLSKRGKITVVNHTNALIVYDTRENIRKIQTLIERLDVEVAQISIAAKIIEVSSGMTNNLGIQWSLFDGRIQHLPTEVPGKGIVAGALERATYGILSQKNFSIALEYLFSESDADIVAQPQITTLDNKEARIFMGSQIPVKYLDDAQNTIIKMIDAGTELTVTPHISGEGRIMLDLQPTKKSYEIKEGAPIINEQSAQTNVVVNDGETVVIAGLTSDEKRISEEGIPVLKDIPLLGHLFKRSMKSRDKKDLIIFVTPHIIKNSISTATYGINERYTDPDSLTLPSE